MKITHFLFQCGVRVPGRDVTSVGHYDGRVSARADGPRGGRPVRPVRRPPGRLRRLRLHGEGVEPPDGRVPAHPVGPHQPGVLAAVRRRSRRLRQPGHLHPRLGRRNGRLQARPDGTPVPHLGHGAQRQHPRIRQCRLHRQGLGHHLRPVSTNTVR